MHKRTVLYGVARLLQVMGLALTVPAAIAWFDTPGSDAMARLSHPAFSGFWIAILAALLFGSAIAAALRRSSTAQNVREGFAIVTLGWMVLAVFGAIPFAVWFAAGMGDLTVSGLLLAFTDAVFEIMSGFTTTGSTILRDIEAVPRGLLFWRSLTHWLGGMGIVTLALVIFPAMGVSGYHMFKGEVPGPTTERLQPRLARTATILWGVYALLTLVQTLLLMVGGMDWFDATCHAFGTMATGGFSTKNSSVGFFDSELVHWVTIVFMFLAGVNFLLHYNALRGNFSLFKTDREFRFYAGVIIAAVLVSTLTLQIEGLPSAESTRTHFRNAPAPYEDFVSHVHHEGEKVASLYGSFRESAFQVVSIVTTTGFATADFDLWPNTLRLLLVVLMFFGGCAGSTGGGMKMIRVMINLKAGWREIIKMAQPRIIRPIKIGDVPVEEARVGNIVSFFILFLTLTVFSALLLSLFTTDLVTAGTAVVACLANVGPGLAGVGAIEHYAWMPIPGKWILIFNMLLGRLEIFTVLVLFRKTIWR
ncbi:MAG: TrkH family potassium uptake protein [Bacteroidota bacterium]|jgi:trk system potassium uptake protein TrkH|nr:TrkH family potassium uptake protein [Bacteroidota bacterium]